MPGTGANLFLQRRHAPSWLDSIQAKVGFSLFLLVFLAIPAFLLMVQNKYLVLYYLIHPAIVSFGIYLLYRGKQYIGSLVIVLSVYAVFVWMASLVGFSQLTPLNWWIIALLPWVMFTEKQRAGLWFTTALPVVFSFALPYMPAGDSRLLPAEQDFIRQILRISVALGAFCCIYFLRSLYYQSERLRLQENEFYSNTLNAIPLPIIIKDGITLDYVFFNQAAQLTYDLNPKVKNNNTTTFSESCATTVSRLDQEVLRSVTYHIEPDENLVHQTGLHWHFRTYRVPLELKSSGRRLLICVSEDLRAIDHVLQKAQKNHEMLSHVYHVLSPLLFRFELGSNRLSYISPESHPQAEEEIPEELCRYLEYHLPRHHTQASEKPGYHHFSLGERAYDLFYGYLSGGQELTCIVIEARPRSGGT